MTRIGRPLVGTVSSAGNLDGRVAAANGRACDPRGSWSRWHAMRPAEDWLLYKAAYEAAYAAEAREGATP